MVRYDRNKVVEMKDPIVKITSVPMITESRAMKSSVSLILADCHCLTGFLVDCLTVRSNIVISVLTVTHSADSHLKLGKCAMFGSYVRTSIFLYIPNYYTHIGMVKSIILQHA